MLIVLTRCDILILSNWFKMWFLGYFKIFTRITAVRMGQLKKYFTKLSWQCSLILNFFIFSFIIFIIWLRSWSFILWYCQNFLRFSQRSQTVPQALVLMYLYVVSYFSNISYLYYFLPLKMIDYEGGISVKKYTYYYLWIVDEWF